MRGTGSETPCPALLSGDLYSPEKRWTGDLSTCFPPLSASLELVVGRKHCPR